MPEEREQPKRRWSRRYVATHQKAPLWVELVDAPTTIRASASIVDISLGGAQIRVKAPITVGDVLRLELVSAEPPIDMHVTAKVCSVRQGSAEEVVVGCAFQKPLHPDMLEQLFLLQAIERRKFHRAAVSVPARIDWELGPRNVPAVIRDFSDGGFSFEVPDAGPPAQRLRVSLLGKDGEEVLLSIAGLKKWQKERDRSVLIGCEYVNRADFHRMREALMPACETHPRRWSWLLRLMTAGMAGCAGIVYLAVC